MAIGSLLEEIASVGCVAAGIAHSMIVRAGVALMKALNAGIESVPRRGSSATPQLAERRMHC
jgi:hypothetical protein